MTTYDQYVCIQDLKYTGFSAPPENHTIPEKPAFSTLGAVADIDYSRKINYYVIYGAIDLMNYHYTSKDPSGKIVFIISIRLSIVVEFFYRGTHS